MSDRTRKNRLAFRPGLLEVSLEDRVVLSSVTPFQTAPSAALSGGVSVNPSITISPNLVPTSTSSSVTAQSSVANITTRQIQAAFRQQALLTQIQLRQFVANELRTLSGNATNLTANGRLSPAGRAQFNAAVAGAVNAAALRLSTQASLLPGSATRLVPSIQAALLGRGSTSLTNRLTNLVNSGRLSATQSTQLMTALNRQINSAFASNAGQLNRFFRTTPLNRLSVDATTGQRIPLSQFLANSAVSQINNTFGTLANSVSPLARTALFNTTGALNSAAVAPFQQQFANALSTAGFMTNNVLSLFPNAISTLAPQIQSNLFATGIDNLTGLPFTSFQNGLSGIFTPTGVTTSPLSSSTFNTAFQNAFTPAFQGLTTPINSFFGVTPTTGTGGSFQLPTGFFQNGASFPSAFLPQFMGSTFNNGFNNGFNTTGTGFFGFGTAPTGFNTGFGTGFNSFIGNANQLFGLTGPTTISTGTGTVTGGGTTGTGTGGTVI